MEPLAEPVTASAARPSATGKERVVALDGLRAVALLIIMGFHFGVGWLEGGFFSLDIFYVLSGYLITGLLLGEYPRRSGIRLAAFWLRRARRSQKAPSRMRASLAHSPSNRPVIR